MTPRRQRVRRPIGQALIVDTAWRGLTEDHDAHRRIDQQKVFQHMPLFLAAITRFLFSRVCGARDGSLGAVMTKRGTTAGVAASSASDGATAEGASASGSPREWRKASSVRQGASPMVRMAFR